MARRWGADLAWLLPAVLALLIPTVAALLLLTPATREPLTHATGAGFTAVLAHLLWCVGRASTDAPATRRFWQTISVGLCCYAFGMLLDLAGALAHTAFDLPVARYGTAFVFPVAGLIMLAAMFRYPTTARTRSERATVALDAGIVLLSSAGFLWYFSVSLAWSPSASVRTLMNALAVPVTTLLAGFVILKIAYLGTRVVCRPTLTLFGASVACSIAGSSLQAFNADPQLAAGIAVGALAHLTAIAGAFVQYRHNRHNWHQAAPATRPARRPGPAVLPRQLSSALPYSAVAAAFVLLFVVARGALGWRESGVLAAFGMLLCVVVARQLLALRENRRLLANNERLAEQLRQQAWYDELTGLPNRAHYSDSIDRVLRRCRTTDSTVAMLLIDLDDFKDVNDTLGHAAGDELLRVMSGRLNDTVGDLGTMFRLGGDEFVAIIEDADAAAVSALADTLVRVVAEPVPLHDRPVRVGASIGVRFVDGSQPTVAGDLLRSADIAMYEAKAAGKGNWRIAAPPVPRPARPAPRQAGQRV